MQALRFLPRLDGVIHYRDTVGFERPALVFANSLGTDMRVWSSVVDHFAGEHRIVQYDKRGHGLSTGPVTDLTIADLASDLAFLLDHLEITNAVILGLSVGGMIAQELASTRPDLVRGLVLSNTGHKIGTPDMWQTRIDAIEAGGIEPMADAVMERWFSEEFRSTRTAELNGWRAMLTRTPAAGYAAVCGAIAKADLTSMTADLTVPTLCIAGGSDGATPPALVRELAGLIAESRYREIPGAGHLPCVEDPTAVIAAITEFFKEAGLEH